MITISLIVQLVDIPLLCKSMGEVISMDGLVHKTFSFVPVSVAPKSVPHYLKKIHYILITINDINKNVLKRICYIKLQHDSIVL